MTRRGGTSDEDENQGSGNVSWAEANGKRSGELVEKDGAEVTADSRLDRAGKRGNAASGASPVGAAYSQCPNG